MIPRIPLGVPVPLPPQRHSRSWDDFSSRIRPRDSERGVPKISIIVAAVIGGIVLLALTIIFFRKLRARHPDPKYIPTPFFKRLWTNWTPWSQQYAQAPGEGDSPPLAGGRSRGGGGGSGASRDSVGNDADSDQATGRTRTTNRDSGTTVDRNTSVRSVMTLPAYRLKASDAERVLGIEGERDGIDVVVEMPTAEEEEAMRDHEMEALYQIRQARRRQVAEREERRQRRADARARHDNVALRDLRDQARLAGTNDTEEIAELREDHERAKETRQRAVSSVSYADVGVARLDGTRVRAGSMESERVGLLSDAASIAISTRSPTSLSQHPPHSGGGRARSSSVLSVDTFHSRPGSPGLPPATTGRHSRAGSRSASPLPRRLSSSMTRAGSSPELIDSAEADLGDADMPTHSPPGYDEVSLVDGPAGSVYSVASGRNSPYAEPPPDYPGPNQARNQRLSTHIADLLVAEGATAPSGLGISQGAPVASSEEDDSVPRRNSRGVGGVPQLPSLRLTPLPQIVVEPSSAMPGENGRHSHQHF